MQTLVEFEIIHCANCGMPFGVTKDRVDRLRECHNTFYCPIGHAQSFTGENEKERLQRELKRLQQLRQKEVDKRRAAIEKRRKTIAEKATKKTTKRKHA